MNPRVSWSWFVGAALLASVACDDSFVKGWLVDRTRVLGARVEAPNEPSRAAIAPGENARVTWLVGAPNGTPRRLHWAIATCAVSSGNFPEPRCENRAVFASANGMSDGAFVPMEITVPAAEVIGQADQLLVLAAFCEEEPVTALEPKAFSATCTRGEATLASLNIRLTTIGPNRNPEIGDSIVFDGAPIPTPAAIACAGTQTSISVAPGSKHVFGYRFRSEEREPIQGEAKGMETLLVSHVVNAGELDRQYSALAPEETAREATVEWTAPGATAGQGESIAEIFFVLRDGRGGTALAHYVACVR